MKIPNIKISINLRKLKAAATKAGVGDINFDNYVIFNNAQDPDTGEYYWDAVNYGRKALSRINDTSIRIKGGKEERTTTDKRLSFSVNGRVINPRSVGPVAPVHMRERVMPKVNKYFVQLLRSLIRRTKITYEELTDWRDQDIYVGGIKQTFSVEYVTRPERVEQTPLVSRRGPSPMLKSIMAQTLDYTVSQLARITPILKPEYYSAGYVSEPGTLRGSYGWRNVGSRTNMLELGQKIGMGEELLSAMTGKYHHTSTPYRKVARELRKLINLHQERSRMAGFVRTGGRPGIASLFGKVNPIGKNFGVGRTKAEHAVKVKKLRITAAYMKTLKAKRANESEREWQSVRRKYKF